MQPTVNPGVGSGDNALALRAKPNGDAILVWRNAEGSLQTASLPAHKRVWSRVTTIADNALSTNIKLLIDNRGNALATWQTNNNILVATSKNFSWSTPKTLWQGDGSRSLDLVAALSDYGTADFVWCYGINLFTIGAADLF
jgi:hypothetical protein